MLPGSAGLYQSGRAADDFVESLIAEFGSALAVALTVAGTDFCCLMLCLRALIPILPSVAQLPSKVCESTLDLYLASPPALSADLADSRTDAAGSLQSLALVAVESERHARDHRDGGERE